jgi:hypothetical protein
VEGDFSALESSRIIARRRAITRIGNWSDRAEVQRILTHWQGDSNLAGVRDQAALEKLLPDEQKAFTQLWVDVAALLKRAETPAGKEGK